MTNQHVIYNFRPYQNKFNNNLFKNTKQLKKISRV